MADEDKSTKADVVSSGETLSRKSAWKVTLIGTWKSLAADHLSIVAAGVAFYILLGIIPALAAAISIYGLVSDPQQIRDHFAAMEGVMPKEANRLLLDQMDRIAGRKSGAGFAAILGMLLALWAGSRGTQAIMEALNIAFDRKEKRGFVKRALVRLGLTLAMVTLGLLAVSLLVVLPPVLQALPLPPLIRNLLGVAIWPLLLALGIGGLTMLYRFGPSREKLDGGPFTVGSITAALLWLLVSTLFGLYAGNFGSYNKTYGSLGAIVITLLWFYLSAFVLLLGAELDHARNRTKPEAPAGSHDQGKPADASVGAPAGSRTRINGLGNRGSIH